MGFDDVNEVRQGKYFEIDKKEKEQSKRSKKSKNKPKTI